MAQDEHEYETIFSKKANRNFSNLRLFGGMNYTYMPIFQKNKTYNLQGIGFDVNLSYKKKYLIGLNFTSIGEFPIDANPQNPYSSTLINQLGLSLTYKPKPERAFHALYGLKIGSLNAEEITIKPNEPFTTQTASGFFVNPFIGLETNLFPWLGVQVNAGYNFAHYQDILGSNFPKNFSGLAFQVGFVLGNLR